MTVNCLICGKPTSATHMGMDACRACTVFYRPTGESLCEMKRRRYRIANYIEMHQISVFSQLEHDRRNRNIAVQLMCVNGHDNCLENGKNIFACRKCRLDRFEAVMRAGNGDAMLPTRRTNISTEFEILMEQIINTPQQTNSLVDRIRANLQVISVFRCTGELQLRGLQVLSEAVNLDDSPLIPCTYQFMEDATKILIPGLFEFSQAVFPEFQMLSQSDKWLLIRNFEKIFHCLDAELRTMRRFGLGSFNIFGTYTTYLSLDTSEYFFSDCPDQRNIATAAKTLFNWLNEHVSKMKKQLYQIAPSEEEFLAMIGLALWSVENLDASDAILSLSARYRTEIMAELTAHYRRTIGVERGASRIGTILCLLQEFRRAVMTIKPDYDVYLLLGTFDESTLMCKLPVT